MSEEFRKKPVVIEAVRWTGSSQSIIELVEWSRGEIWFDNDGPVIETLEGPLHASLNDWIIKGVQGEFYPCKPDIFEQTYEPASVPVLETPAEAVFCDHSQWRECAATLEMVRDLSDKALNYTAAYDLANDLAAILAGSDDAIPGALVEPVPAPTGIDPSELMRALHANLTPLAHVEVTDRRPYGMSEDTIQVWPITGVRSVVNHLALKSAPVPAPSENLNKGEEMIALFDEVKLDGFTIQFKDKEQMEANKTADNSPTPWSEKTPLAESVKRWKSQGQTATLLLVYGVVLAMTGGPNHFARTVIDQHVIVGSNPVRVVSMKISNE
jgi:hypothetical protein